MKYLSWDEKNILTLAGTLPDEKIISDMYAKGYVFTRVGKGVMQQTRAVRIDLAQFELSSENRRILRKISETPFGPVIKKEIPLPLAATDYHWSLAKLAKDFYEKKFGPGIMTAVKIKELVTDGAKSNFNCFFSFALKQETGIKPIGAAICYKNADLLHYSYPFYDLDNIEVPKDIGLGMMTLAIEHAREAGLGYAYLGSLQRPGDAYKLQFKGIEWYDGGPDGTGTWQTDIEKAKTILK